MTVSKMFRVTTITSLLIALSLDLGCETTRHSVSPDAGGQAAAESAPSSFASTRTAPSRKKTNASVSSTKHPYAQKTDREGFVVSPYAKFDNPINVSGIKRGSQVKCPYTGKIFLVP